MHCPDNNFTKRFYTKVTKGFTFESIVWERLTGDILMILTCGEDSLTVGCQHGVSLFRDAFLKNSVSFS